MAPPSTAPAVDCPDDAVPVDADARSTVPAPARPVSGAAGDLDPAADAQRRLDEMLDLLRREQAEARPPAPAPAPAPAWPPAAPPAAEAPKAEAPEADAAPVDAAGPVEEKPEELPEAEAAEAEGEGEEQALGDERLDAVEPADGPSSACEIVAEAEDGAETDQADEADAEPAAARASVEPRRETSASPADDPFRSLASLGLAKPAGAAPPPSAARPPLRSLLSEMFELDLSDVNDGFDVDTEDAVADLAPTPDETEEERAEPSPRDVSDAVADASVAPAEAAPAERGAAPQREAVATQSEDEAETEEEAVAEEAPAEEAVADAPSSAAGDSAAGDSVDQSVDDYMEALLARMRQSREETPTPTAPKPRPRPAAPAAKPAAAAPSPAAASPAGLPKSRSATAMPAPPALAPLPPPPSLPRSRVDKEKLREEMRQLRAIANTSARSAVMESTWKRTRTRLVMGVLMCGVSLGLGLVLILTSVWGHTVHYGLGGALCIAAVWIARDFGRTMDLLRRQKIAATKATAAEAAEAGVDPHEAGERALNVPSAA